jgi:hypothetical protein
MNHALRYSFRVCAVVVTGLMLASCATGQAFKTTVLEGGKTMTYESKTTGAWFYSKPSALMPSEDTLELK